MVVPSVQTDLFKIYFSKYRARHAAGRRLSPWAPKLFIYAGWLFSAAGVKTCKGVLIIGIRPEKWTGRKGIMIAGTVHLPEIKRGKTVVVKEIMMPGHQRAESPVIKAKTLFLSRSGIAAAVRTALRMVGLAYHSPFF